MRRSKIDVDLRDFDSSIFLKELIDACAGDSFKEKYLREELLSKYCDEKLTPASQRATRAVAKWLDTEERNRATNSRLMFAWDKDFGWTTWSEILDHARRLIRRVIGSSPVSVVYDPTPPTTGASIRVRRSPEAAVLKLTRNVEVSETAIKDWLQLASCTRLSSLEIITWNESHMFTVPKKSDIDRVACKEPSGNMLLQRGVGLYFRRRLRRVGIDLQDQSRNRDLAKRASARELDLATIDLSSASDSISRQLVFDLLPWDWFALLDDIRVRRTLIPGGISPTGLDILHDLEMFSSMGNGFTFELESLIFWALTRAVMKLSGIDGIVSVYGDDIIAPNRVVARLERVFHFVGFRMNRKKTFNRGLFRESCGGHYYAGFDVTPFYVRREVRTLPDLINLLNQFLWWSGRGWGFLTDPLHVAFHRRWSAYVPKWLHGGFDPHDPTALVTGDSPRMRLVPMTRAVRGLSADASLTYWLLARARTNTPVGVNPEKAIGVLARRNTDLGGRTTWRPYIIDIRPPVVGGEV